MLACRHSEQVSGCVCLWGAAVGDVHRSETLEWLEPHADPLQRHHPEKEAAIPARHSSTFAGKACRQMCLVFSADENYKYATHMAMLLCTKRLGSHCMVTVCLSVC